MIELQWVNTLWMYFNVESDAILVYWVLIADTWLNTFLESSSTYKTDQKQLEYHLSL